MLVFAVGTFLLAAPAAAVDPKVEQAVSKAIGQIEKNRDDINPPLQSAAKLAKEAKKPHSQAGAARIYEAAGKLEDALAHARKAVGLSGSAVPAFRAATLAHIAALELRIGSSKDALARAREAAALSSDEPVTAVLVRALAARKDAGALAQADTLIKASPSAIAHDARAWALFAGGKHEEAAAAFAKATALDPKLYRAHVGRARALLAAGQTDAAEQAARAATVLDKNQPEAWAALGEAIVTKDPKNWSPAVDAAQVQGALLHPKCAYAKYVVGSIFEASGNYGPAADAYREAVGSDPSYTKASIGLVRMEIRNKKLEAAVAEAARLASDESNDAEAQILYGDVLLRTGDYAVALDPLERAARLDPKNADAHALLAQAYENNHQAEEAEASWNKALALAPRRREYRAAGFVALGRMYRSANPPRISDAIIVYKKALDEDPKNASAQLGMGWALYLRKAWPEAIAAFSRAVDLEPRVGGEASLGIGWSAYGRAAEVRSSSTQKARDAALAARAQLTPSDTRPDKLLAALDAYERKKQVAAPPVTVPVDACPDLGTLVPLSRAGEETARARAIRSMVCSGASAVQYLVPLLRDSSLAVKTAAAKSLRAIPGSAPKAACETLQKEVDASQKGIMLPNELATEEELSRQLERGRELQDAARAAIQRHCKT
jgi:tetratricopeptide (TPR) repeat protein